MPILIAPGDIITEPPTPLMTREHLRHLWHGWDGSDWDICDRRSGVRLGAGTRGLTYPDMQFYSSDSPAVDGAFDRGYRALPRDVFWPLRIWSDGTSQDWLDYDRAFWRTLQPGKTGVWEVIQPNGVSRQITLRLVDDGGQSFDTDPALIGWAKYGVRLVANQPLWEGEPVTARFAATVAGDTFFDADRYITSSYTLASAAIANPGDVPAWPVWSITGPCTLTTITIDGHVLQVPITLTGAQTLIIDTDPTAQTALLGNVDRSGDLGAADFAPIQPGATVPLGLTMTGTGMVAVSITPRYYRAW